MAALEQVFEQALGERFANPTKDPAGIFHVEGGATAWLEPVGSSVFVRVALPRRLVPSNRWIPQDVGRSHDEHVRTIADAAAEYLADELGRLGISRT